MLAEDVCSAEGSSRVKAPGPVCPGQLCVLLRLLVLPVRTVCASFMCSGIRGAGGSADAAGSGANTERQSSMLGRRGREEARLPVGEVSCWYCKDEQGLEVIYHRSGEVAHLLSGEHLKAQNEHRRALAEGDIRPALSHPEDPSKGWLFNSFIPVDRSLAGVRKYLAEAYEALRCAPLEWRVWVNRSLADAMPKKHPYVRQCVLRECYYEYLRVKTFGLFDDSDIGAGSVVTGKSFGVRGDVCPVFNIPEYDVK